MLFAGLRCSFPGALWLVLAAAYAGSGWHMDESAFPLMTARQETVGQQTGSDDIDYYDDVPAGEPDSNGGNSALHRPPPDAPVNVAVFQSGWGGGVYPVFGDLDQAGTTRVLLTGFHVIENADARSAETGETEKGE